MESIYIVGASGAAKEVFLLIEQINAAKNTYAFKGFIDINPVEKSLQIGKCTYPVFDESDFVKTQTEKINIVFAIGDALVVNKITTVFKNKSNFSFPNLIHPKVYLNDSISLGEGNVICEGSILTIDIHIKSFNYINRGVQIGHDTAINSFNVINPSAVISGGVTIENHNLIGTHSTILQYLAIGSKNKMGAGAVITKSIKDNFTMVGVPAKSVQNE